MPRAAHQLEEHQLHEPETVTTDPNPTESQGAEVPALPPSDPSFYERLGPAGRTVVEAMAIAAINMVLALVLQSLHLQLFLAAPENVHSIELLRKINPAVLFVLAVAIAPVLEESLFRGLPFLIMRGLSRWGEMQDITRQVVFWGLGGCAAVLFAFAHANSGASFHLPLPQFLFGLWSWHVINTRGLRYSILLHGVHNLLLSTLLLRGAS